MGRIAAMLARRVRRLAMALLAACVLAPASHAADPAKVLHIASADIETLDPQGYTDDPSYQVLITLFEPLYEWDSLGSLPKLVPLTADGPPQIGDGGKTWTIRVKRGIRFIDDPAFKGKPRELTAEDYIYSYKRWMDPNGHRGGDPIVANLLVGARPVVDAASATGKFDFDRPIEGLRALDRYTLQLRLSEPNYPNIRDMLGFVGAVAREVVDARGGDIREHPVGTGPYRLREWKRGSRIVLEANPLYRDASLPGSDKPGGDALERGKRVPAVGIVDIAIIEEDVTRLLEFERGGLDVVQLRGEAASRLLSGEKLKPQYAAQGIVRHAVAEPFLFSTYFNMKDPVIGGLDNARVALRRAIAMGFDVETLVKVVYAGQAIAANQLVPPGVGGHDPSLPVKSLYDPAGANALLDRFGYGRRDPENYRTASDGKPLTVTLSLRAGAISREMQTLWKRNMDAIGIRMAFRVAPFQEIIKELEAHQFQMYLGGFGGSPSGYPELMQLYSKQSPRFNVSQFDLPAYDRAAEAFLAAESDAAQLAAARTMSDLARAYMPELPVLFRVESDFVQPWVQGFRPPVFQSYWKYVDIDAARGRVKGKGRREKGS